MIPDDLPDSLIEAASFTPRSIQPPNAWVGHLPFAAWVIRQVMPEIFVELGTHSGNSYFSVCQSVAENRMPTRCYAVDTWQGDEHAGQYSEAVFSGVDAHNREYYAGFSRLLRMTFDAAAPFFSDKSIGLLHIDGLHTYDAVRHDFETWLPRLAPGAVVMFHDTNVRELDFGVWKFWEELQKQYPDTLEFPHSHGLGVLQLNNGPEDGKLFWLQSGYRGKQRLQHYFAALGLSPLERFEVNELSRGVGERGTRIIRLEQTVTQKDLQIKELKQTIDQKEGRIFDLNAHIDALLQSTSWRVTRPLRQAAQIKTGMTGQVQRFLAGPMGRGTEKYGGNASDQSRISGPPADRARPLEIDFSACVPFGFEMPPLSDTGRVAAVIHLFYQDLAVEFRSYLANVPVDMDIYISTTDGFKAAAVESAFAGWPKGRVEVRIVPNQGRDIAPKLVTFRDVYSRYDYVLFLHGKRSPHAGALLLWRHFLLESLAGNPQIVKNILYAFSRHPDLGIISVQHFEPVRNAINWGGNFAAARKLAMKMGFALNPEDPLDFPSGSMFWARTTALKPLLDLELTTQDFETESNQIDATLAHAVERLFFHVCEHQGLGWMKIARPELYGDTPMIVDMRYRADLSNFMEQYLFRLLDPRGVRPRAVTPDGISWPAPALPGHVQSMALGMHIVPSLNTRVAIGLVTLDHRDSERTGAIRSAQISLASAGFRTEEALFLADMGTGTGDRIQEAGFVRRVEAWGLTGSGAGHNILMKTAFEAGYDIYIAVSPGGQLHPAAVKALVQMVQAAQGKALVEALPFPAARPKPYDPYTFETPWVSSTCLALSKEAFHDLGGFDARLSTYWKDADLSWRARARGYALKTCARALFLNPSAEKGMTLESRRVMLASGILLARKWGNTEWETRLAQDPAWAGNTVPEEGAPEKIPSEWHHLADFSGLPPV